MPNALLRREIVKLNISKQLSKLMRDNNLSQSSLSRATGVPQPTINRILSEVTREPRRDTVVRIANFFGITPESFYESGGSKADRTPAAETVEEIYKRIAMLSITDRSELFDRVSTNLK
jgi:transcriptional regulator with XRE-family HTH domain